MQNKQNDAAQDWTRLCLTRSSCKISEFDYWDHRHSPQFYHYEKLCGCKCRRAIFHIHEPGKQPSSKLHPGAESSGERSFLIWFSASPRGRGGSSCWWRSRCCRCCCCCQTSPSSGRARHSTVQTQLSGFLQTTTETTCLHWTGPDDAHTRPSCGSTRNDQDVKNHTVTCFFFLVSVDTSQLIPTIMSMYSSRHGNTHKIAQCVSFSAVSWCWWCK